MYHHRQRVLIGAAMLTVLSTGVGDTRALAQSVNKASVIQGPVVTRLDSIRAAIASQVVIRQPPGQQQRHFPNVVGRDSLVARRLLLEYGFFTAIRDTAVSDVALYGKVVRQQPDTSVSVPSGSVDTLIVGAAPPPPPPDTNVRMPDVQIIVRDTATASGPIVPGTDTLPVPPPQPTDDKLWKWIAAAIAALAAVAAAAYTIKQRANRMAHERVAAMHVVPHTDVHPEVHLDTHDDETADQAFARIGLAFHAITDPGAQQIELIPPPRSGDEDFHV